MTGWSSLVDGMRAIGNQLFVKVLSSDENRTIVLGWYHGQLVLLKLWEKWRVLSEVEQVRRLPHQPQQHSSSSSSPHSTIGAVETGRITNSESSKHIHTACGCWFGCDTRVARPTHDRLSS